ncbi:MAG TPA: LCCL domain-containing protein [Pyrinomonadaceae bacterium]|jgi:hypothetical protein|nr:LCCL domain-containing protein [Pyrinomonadaceae bacterium]
MKVCPKCGAVTQDETQGFCLMDGAPLVDASASEPTVVMSHSAPTVTVQPVRKKKTGLWILLALVGILIVGAIIGLLMFAAYRMGSQSVSVKANVSGNASPTPKTGANATATPQPTSSVAAVEPTPDNSTDGNVTTDEATPVTWGTNASTFKTDVGLKYAFECPPDGTPSAVWGSDPYTVDSSVCTAAVHAGKITLEKGGTVSIEIAGGRSTYGATTRNGITTYNYGQFPRSFVFRDPGVKKD